MSSGSQFESMYLSLAWPDHEQHQGCQLVKARLSTEHMHGICVLMRVMMHGSELV